MPGKEASCFVVAASHSAISPESAAVATTLPLTSIVEIGALCASHSDARAMGEDAVIANTLPEDVPGADNRHEEHSGEHSIADGEVAAPTNRRRAASDAPMPRQKPSAQRKVNMK